MSFDEEELRIQRRKERIAQMKIEKEKALRRQRIVRKSAPFVGGALALVIGVSITANVVQSKGTESENRPNESITEMHQDGMQIYGNEIQAESGMKDAYVEAEASEPQVKIEEEDIPLEQFVGPMREEVQPVYSAQITNTTNGISDEIISDHVIFLDMESGEILAQKGYQERINPASMTKVLTLLVAAESVTNLDDTFTITLDITDFCYQNDCSNAGFEVGETVTVRDLLYGTILPSGADAALGLAYYIAGGQDAFVELMNQKLEQLGLADTTHFTNCMGIYDKDHYSTVYDIAMIMEAAESNEICKEVLNARTYTTSCTEVHPEGMILSNWFLRRIEDKDTGGEIVGGKTGFVAQAGSCATSCGVDEAGNQYICVTTGSTSSWRCIYDHVALYAKYAKKSE